MNVVLRLRFVGELILFFLLKITLWVVLFIVSKFKKIRILLIVYREVEKNKLLDVKVYFVGWFRYGY